MIPDRNLCIHMALEKTETSYVYVDLCICRLHIRSEYGIENVKLFWQWEKLECKMADFQNHRRFLLRCLNQDVIPVSIRLKSNVKTPRGLYIVKRVERSLLNERIRSVNNTINMLKIQRDTCIDQLKTCLDGRTMEECELFIDKKRESSQNSTLVRQLQKFEQLCHKNKIQGSHSSIWEKQDGHSNIRDEQDIKEEKNGL